MTTLSINDSVAVPSARPTNAVTLHAVFEQASDGIALIDDTHTIVTMNPAFERLIGRPAVDLIGRAGCRSVLACEDVSGRLLCDRHCPIQEAFTAETTISSQELLLGGGTGIAAPVSAGVTPLHLSPGDRRMALVIVRTITDRHRKTQRLRHPGLTDPLTGLDNHRSLMTQLRREITRARRYRHALSLLYIDLDEFKRYNDERGRSRGDEALAAVGRILNSHMRETDIAARYGGEEFVLLLPETDKPQARILAEQLCRVIARQLEERPPSPAGGRTGLTVSIGVASFPSDANNGTGLLEQAGRALYAARAAGRNRVASSPSDPAAVAACAAGLTVPLPHHHTSRSSMRGGPS